MCGAVEVASPLVTASVDRSAGAASVGAWCSRAGEFTAFNTAASGRIFENLVRPTVVKPISLMFQCFTFVSRRLTHNASIMCGHMFRTAAADVLHLRHTPTRLLPSVPTAAARVLPEKVRYTSLALQIERNMIL